MVDFSLSWITLFPDWYRQERSALAQHYPNFVVDQHALRAGILDYYGELTVRPSGDTFHYPVWLRYPEATPYAPPMIKPLRALPLLDEQGHPRQSPEPRYFDHRHQMPSGNLCLFETNPRSALGPEAISGVEALDRAEKWFLGHHTGHWPPDTEESELEAHFWPVFDMLVGEPFYDSDIAGHGRFYATLALGRVEDIQQSNYPFILVCMTSENGIEIPKDVRYSLSRTFPYINSAAIWDINQLPEVEQKNAIGLFRDYRLIRGYWWDLKAEPTPFHDGAGLLRTLFLAKDGEDSWTLIEKALGKWFTDEQHWIGFRYPARGGGLEWLVVSVLMSKQQHLLLMTELTPEKKQERFERAQIVGVRIHSCRPEDLRRRNATVINADIVEKTVALIGLGALGSVVADLLAKAGIGHFRLCDYDRLSVGNVARHIGGVSDFGAYKTRIIRTRLLDINPYLALQDGEDILTGSAVGALDQLRKFLEPADLVISTTADESVETILNQIAVGMKKPVIYARALRRGKVGRVFLVRPGEDACKSCLTLYANNSGESAPEDWISVTEQEDDVLMHECGRPVVPASAMDMNFIANLCSRIALSYLQGRSLNANHWIWSVEPASDLDERLNTELQVLPLNLAQNPQCPVCVEPPIEKLVLAESAYKAIISMTEDSPHAETCGILIGYVNQRVAVVLKAVGPGPDAERSQSICSRDPQFAQWNLELAFEEWGLKGQYLGEWHSHLEANPSPSPTDVDSLLGIARAPLYHTSCPVMVIAGLGVPDSGKVKNLHVSVYSLNGRIYTLPYAVIPNEQAMNFDVTQQISLTGCMQPLRGDSDD